MKTFLKSNIFPLGILIITLILMFIGCHAHAQTADAMTNAPASGGVEDTFNWLVNLNNKLLGAPAGVLVFALMFLIDSVCYYAEFCPNRLVPVVSFFGGAIFYFLLSWKVGSQNMPTVIWVTKNIALGLIIGLGAWIASLRWGMTLILKTAGKPDPSPPLPETPPAPPVQKIEVVVEQKPPTP